MRWRSGCSCVAVGAQGWLDETVITPVQAPPEKQQQRVSQSVRFTIEYIHGIYSCSSIVYLFFELHRCCVLQIPVQCEVVQYQCGDQTSGTVSKGRRAALSDSDRHQEGSDGLSDAAAQDHCDGAVARPVHTYIYTYSQTKTKEI